MNMIPDWAELVSENPKILPDIELVADVNIEELKMVDVVGCEEKIDALSAFQSQYESILQSDGVHGAMATEMLGQWSDLGASEVGPSAARKEIWESLEIFDRRSVVYDKELDNLKVFPGTGREEVVSWGRVIADKEFGIFYDLESVEAGVPAHIQSEYFHYIVDEEKEKQKRYMEMQEGLMDSYKNDTSKVEAYKGMIEREYEGKGNRLADLFERLAYKYLVEEVNDNPKRFPDIYIRKGTAGEDVGSRKADLVVVRRSTDKKENVVEHGLQVLVESDSKKVIGSIQLTTAGLKSVDYRGDSVIEKKKRSLKKTDKRYGTFSKLLFLESSAVAMGASYQEWKKGGKHGEVVQTVLGNGEYKNLSSQMLIYLDKMQTGIASKRPRY